MTSDPMHNILFIWDNLGPTHLDRCEAVAEALGDAGSLTVGELYASSATYGWRVERGDKYAVEALFDAKDTDRVNAFAMAWRIVGLARRSRASSAFLWGYQLLGVFLAACILRLLGVKVFVFNDSKFDDKPRHLARELFKNIYCIPFHGALTASERGADYMRLRGFEKRPVEFHYDNISIQRIRAAATSEPAPGGVAHSSRYFLSIARLVEKKNHRTLLRAYAHYAGVSEAPRPLILCGWGPLEDELKALAQELKISELVEFAGWQQAEAVIGHLCNALCLLLPSVEEQFGIAVLEAQAMGLPVIVSENVGARDLHVRSGVNGFLVEANNPLGLSYFMQQLAEDPVLWRRLSKQAYADAELGDTVHFVQSVFQLCGIASPAIPQSEPRPADALGVGVLQSA